MSDAGVLKAIEQMEAWLEDPERAPDAESLAAWNRVFTSEAANAERGPGWDALAERAQGLSARVEAFAARLGVQRDQVRAELDAHGRGGRALKGYGATTR